MHFSLIILIAAVFVGLVKGGLGPVAGALIVHPTWRMPRAWSRQW